MAIGPHRFIESGSLKSSLKKALLILAVAIIAAALAAPAYAQPASPPVASAQGEAPELRVAAIIAPPGVMEQNGTLTGFSIDLWNAIAARLKVKTSYQIVPDVSHLEEALRSKNADLTTGLFITSARDTDFDFRSQHCKRACKLWCAIPDRRHRPQARFGTCSVCCFREQR